MKNWEYMLQNKNKSIIEEIKDDELLNLFVDVINVITRDIPEWQKEYIFKKDDYIWNYEKSKRNMAILEEDIWKTVTEKKEVNIRALDLPALLKLLQFRLFSCKKDDRQHKVIKKTELSKSFEELIIFTRKNFRNASAHSSLVDQEEGIFADNSSIYKNLCIEKEYLEQVAHDSESYLRAGREVRTILENFIETKWNPIIEAYYKAKIGEDIDYTYDKPIRIEDLASYNIIVDYTVFFKEGGYRCVNVFIEATKRIFAEQAILSRLKNTQMQGDSFDKEKAKEIVKTLAYWIDTGKLTLLESASVIDKLSRAKQAKWCVLTEDPHLANDVWDIRKKNVIAVKPKTRNSYEIFRINRNETSRDEFMDKKFKVEIVSGTGESKLEENIRIEESKINDVLQYKNEVVVPSEEKVEPQKRKNLKTPKAGMKVFVGEPDQEYKDTLYKLFREGGEGRIYELEDDRTVYAKIYKPKQLTPQRVKKIEAMVSRQDEIPEGVCWPEDILCHTGRAREKYIVGYTMRKAGSEGKKTLGTVREVIIRISKGEYKWERKNLVELCYNCAQLFEGLHENGILMGDVNPDNIMVDEAGGVYFIDTDSYQFEDFCCPVGKEEFDSPELLKKMDDTQQGYAETPRTLNDECFATAVLYFYILFLAELPYKIEADKSAKECILNNRFRFEIAKESKRNYIWKNLTHKLQEMFRKNFTNKKRYSDGEWITAFDAMLDMSEEVPFERELSNEIFPFSAVEREGEVWESLQCKLCGNWYKMARIPNSPLQSHEKECPKCKVIKKMRQKRIYKLKCPCCNEIWTINGWDTCGKSLDDLKCPDCDDTFYYSNKAEFVEKAETLKKEIERRMSFAFKYKEGEC